MLRLLMSYMNNKCENSRDEALPFRQLNIPETSGKGTEQ